MVRDIYNDNIMLFKCYVCVYYLIFCFIIFCDRYGFKKSYVKKYFYKLGEWKSVFDIFCLFILLCEMYLLLLWFLICLIFVLNCGIG